VKVGRENIFKPAIGNKSFHEINYDNGVTEVNTATSKNLAVRSTMFPHPNIHKYTQTPPDGKTKNHTDHVLIDRRQYSNTTDVQLSRGADCNTDQYLAVAKVRKRLAESK
jgi:hypothetical protein